MNNQNIRVIFTDKAEAAVDDIIKNFNFEETPEDFTEKLKKKQLSNVALIYGLIKDYARGIISEKEVVALLQDKLQIPQETAKKIKKEIINNVIPFLEKVPEEKLKDPYFGEEISKKIWGEQTKTTKRIEETNVLPKIKPLTSIKRELKDISNLPSKKFIEENKETAPKLKQQEKPDGYREPIE